MTGRSAFSYAQVRIQSRYGQRAGEHLWLRLHNIHDMASYLQAAQQTSLQPWILGISSTHSSHEIELALRQKYRLHIDEVASWLPANWRMSLYWIKRLVDLPALQYLLDDGVPLEWMKSDPGINKFTLEDSSQRLKVLHEEGCASLANAWRQGDSLLAGWFLHWNQVNPTATAFIYGLQDIYKCLYQHIQPDANEASATDYDVLSDELRYIFRRYAFQPAAAFAYLAIIAIDIHHLRSDLMQRLWFQEIEDASEGLPV